MRSLRRPQRLPKTHATSFNAARSFTTTISRKAEVEIFVDDKPVKIEGA